MPKYTNGAAVPLSVAVFLASDSYDYEDHTISATGLLKPLRQTILAGRIPPGDTSVDIIHRVRSRIGQAVHDALEQAWIRNAPQALKDLGYPQRVIDRIVINPSPDQLSEDTVPVYLEQRSYREILGVTVSGKFDFVAEGRVEDLKTTQVYTYLSGNKDDDYRWQGSIYRWLNPKIITADEMAINFIFTDWTPGKANDPSYPSSPVLRKVYPLYSLAETEAFIRRKLTLIQQHQDTPEPELPHCTDAELWRRDPVWKYYKNPDKLTRSTKNFDNRQDAYARLAADGHVGVVVEKPGEVVACKYCPALMLCSQAQALIQSGDLQL